MIRSPISAEERLQNRVGALEGRVKELLEFATELFDGIHNLEARIKYLIAVLDLDAAHERLNEHEQRLDFLDGEVGELLENAGII